MTQIILCKTGPDLIWMAWSGSGQKDVVQKQASVQESLGPDLTKRNQPTTSFPFSELVAFSHRVDSLDHIVQNQPGSDLVQADCVRFWPKNLIQKQAGVQESLGLLLANGSKRIQIRCKLDLACVPGKCHHENFIQYFG